MRNFTMQNFEKYFFDVIENSFFELEKKDFYSTLKTLNISNKELVLYFFEILNNHTTQNDDQIELKIKDLPKSTLMQKISTLIETGELKYLDATKALSNYLNSIFTIYMEDLKETNKVQYETSLIAINNSKQLVRERFNYDETKKDNVILIKEDFKGQHSFTLKIKFKTEIFLRVLKKLKENQLVANETSVGRFQKIFSGEEIPNNEKVDWVGSMFELKLFLDNIKSEFSLVNDIYNTALRCFSKDGKEILRTSQISGASYHKKKEQIIIDIVSIFKIRA
jgi:hypothetical protein